MQAATTPAALPTAEEAARFLEQASWGPTPASIAEVQKVGYSAYLDEQFKIPPTVIPAPIPDAKGNTSLAVADKLFFSNANSASDQLRQRVAWALGQIWVTSAVKLNAQAIVYYQNLLAADAFETFPKIMYDVTLSPSMGHYLDMVNNDKPNPRNGKGPNENYAREIMQLFTIGLVELNMDGSVKKDSHGQPIPTYTQDVIEGFARVFTGWTYAPTPGKTPGSHNPQNWTAQMVAVDANHDLESKLLLNNVTLPARTTAAGSAELDLQAGLHNIFTHPNVAPFISRQLIQHLVTSSPSGAYVQRVAEAFKTSNGDMKTVIKAILLDSEARNAPNAGEGHLREPALFVNGLLRSLGATVDPTNNSLSNATSAMGQTIYSPPTVFNYFAPSYEIGGTTINAPEFQILSPSTAMTRVDFVNQLVYGTVGGVKLDLTALETLAATSTSKLLDQLEAQLLLRPMSTQMRTAITTAVNAQTTTKAKAQAALYLVAGSYYYQVER